MSSYINDDVTITDGKGEKSSMKIYDNKILYPIKQVEKIHYSGDVYNIEVENDNTYTAYGFIVHNCLPKDTLALATFVKELNLDLKLFETIDNENKKFKTTVFDGMRSK